MKLFLILFLISNSVYANFIKKNKLGSCEGLTVYTAEEYCGKNCIKIPDNFNCEYAEVKSEKWLKSDAELCGSNMDCQEKLSLKVCEQDYQAIKNLDTMEVYCTKYLPERVADNDQKKLDHLAKLEQKEQKRLSDKQNVISLIESSNLEEWHKDLLKKLIRDMRND